MCIIYKVINIITSSLLLGENGTLSGHLGRLPVGGLHFTAL